MIPPLKLKIIIIVLFPMPNMTNVSLGKLIVTMDFIGVEDSMQKKSYEPIKYHEYSTYLLDSVYSLTHKKKCSYSTTSQNHHIAYKR